MNRKHFVRPAIVTGGILLIPLVMTILDRGKPAGDGWHWGPGDFVVMGALLFGAGLTYEFLAGRIDRKAHRVAAGLAIVFAVLAIWFELAVDGVSRLVKLVFG
jgi:hypothetical protein